MRSSIFLLYANMSETEKLIAQVKSRRFLYDLGDPQYKIRQKRLEAWKEISREMGSGSAHIWSAKWKGLKDNYAKYKKSSIPGFMQAYRKYKHWPWADKVKFLDDCMSTKSRRIYNYTPNVREPSPEYVEVRTPVDTRQDGTNESEENKNQLDGVDHFFLSYAETFKKLPPRLQIMLKLEIATLFTRFELQAEGLSRESIDTMPRIVPQPVKYEFNFDSDILNE